MNSIILGYIRRRYSSFSCAPRALLIGGISPSPPNGITLVVTSVLVMRNSHAMSVRPAREEFTADVAGTSLLFSF